MLRVITKEQEAYRIFVLGSGESYIKLYGSSISKLLPNFKKIHFCEYLYENV